ncbi:MAG: protein kinase [Vicinamibacterales bacterium]
MSIIPGTVLGPYEIVGPLGAGGMGEVYRARDTKLNRDVAIKILPESVALDSVRLARFEREARTLAALNHPHIAQIYGLEDAGARGKALVMELVGGQTLAERIADGAVPIAETLEIARQMADAFECAHAEGIVHRDLKPANIKVRDDGTAKVLDFGLAKSADSGAAPNLQDSPTVTSPAMTERGLILGTAAYMSPEQARGKPVDKRADIWAFGVILFEMLTGRQMFAGETVSDTLAAVLREDVPWSSLPPATPPALRRVLERTLQKDPKRRLRDIGDAKFDIEEAIAGKDLVVAPVAASIQRKPASRLPGIVAAVATAAAVAIAILVAAQDRGRADDVWQQFEQVTDTAGEETFPALSPDGTTVAYASRAQGTWDIYAQRVGGRNRVLIAGDSNRHETGPAFSPDGQRIAFFELDEDGGIFVAGATGESVRRIADSGFHPSWSPDGRQIAFSTEEIFNPYSRMGVSGLTIVDAETGAARSVTEPADFDAAQPSWSPSGERLVFWSNTDGQRDLYTVAAGGGAPVPLLVDPAVDWCPTWAPDGRSIVFASDRGGSMNLWRLALDQSSGEAKGVPEPVTTGVQAASECASFSKDGSRFAFRSRVGSINPVAVPFDPVTLRAGAPVILDSSNSVLVPSDVSPDGRWISVFTIGQRQEDMLVSPSDRFEPRRITDDAPRDRTPVWTADGRSLLFYSTRGGTWEAWRINTDGGGLRRVATTPGGLVYPVLSPSGDRLAFTGMSPPGVYVSQIADDGTAASPRFLKDSSGFMATGWSPDGRQLAGIKSRAAGRPLAVAVYDVAAQALRDVTADSTFWVRWLPDGRRVIYFTVAGELVVADSVSGARTLVNVRLPMNSTDDAFALSRDGRMIYYGGERSESDIWIAERPKR